MGAANGHFNRVFIFSLIIAVLLGTVANVNCRKEDQKRRWMKLLEDGLLAQSPGCLKIRTIERIHPDNMMVGFGRLFFSLLEKLGVHGLRLTFLRHKKGPLESSTTEQ